MIVFDKVKKIYSTGDTILEDVSFKINPQDFVVIHGPSGSGKTTLLRMIYKDIEPSSGSISVDGQALDKIKKRHVPELRRKIGFAFQDFKVIPDRTVWENVSLMLEILNFKKPLIKERLDHLLELIGLQSKAQLFPRQLSGGEVQRVAIARAIAAEPSILLADEPTGNLDPVTSKSIIELLKQINQLGTTVVMASHDIQAYSGMDLRELHLENGRITFDSQPPLEEQSEKPEETHRKKSKHHDKAVPKEIDETETSHQEEVKEEE